MTQQLEKLLRQETIERSKEILPNPEHYQDARWNHYDSRVKDRVKEWARTPTPNLVISGGSGIGKSHLVYLMMQELYQRGHEAGLESVLQEFAASPERFKPSVYQQGRMLDTQVHDFTKDALRRELFWCHNYGKWDNEAEYLYLKWNKVIRWISDTDRYGQTGEAARNSISSLSNRKYLLLNDFGKSPIPELAMDFMDMLEERHENRKPTVIITSDSFEGLIKNIGKPMFRRLCEEAMIIEL